MTSAPEVFVVELARVSRMARKFVRGLSKEDRDDVLSAALLWCWEHRDSYSLTTSLETWFVNAVRDSYKAWQRGELRASAEVLNEIPTADSTLAAVEAREAATKLAASLPPDYRRVAELEAQGYTRAEMVAQGVVKSTIDAARARIKQMRRLIPDPHEYRTILRGAGYVDSDERLDHGAPIDREIEQLEAIPRHGADCPPCWKCKYFEGYLPGPHRRVGMPLQAPEVAAAVAATEARKVKIAKRVRAGLKEAD